MSGLAGHSHDFPPGGWPFAEPVNKAAFTTVRVTREDWPILQVYHDHDGDWQFHWGFIEEDDEFDLFCLGCIFRRDPTVGAVADLPIGWMASREAVDCPWSREAYEPPEEDE